MERNTGVSDPQRRLFFVGKGGVRLQWSEDKPSGAITGKGIEAISKDEARARVIEAGRSLDRFVQLGYILPSYENNSRAFYVE